MVIVSFFKCGVSHSYVRLFIVVVFPGDCCLINNSSCFTLAIQWTGFFVSTVAARGWLWVSFAQDLLVVGGDYLLDVRHCAVAYFNSVPVHDGMKWVQRRETSI